MATYAEIIDDIKAHNGRAVQKCWIAHVKELCGLAPRPSANRQSLEHRVKPCPRDARPLIEASLRRFGMISGSSELDILIATEDSAKQPMVPKGEFRKQTPGWQRVQMVVSRAARPMSAREILMVITESIPEFKISNVAADLRLITVNDYARGHHQGHQRPRRTDTGHRYDLLFKVRTSSGVKFEPYVPSKQGVWELYFDEAVETKSRLRTRPLTLGQLEQALIDAEAEADERRDYELANELDARKWVSRSIVMRRGQRAFRSALIEAYDGACAITGTTAIDVLEAAHISPYRGEHTNRIDNGLLLRADIHTLFDLGHLWVEDTKVCLAGHLANTYYSVLAGKVLRQPSLLKHRPLAGALATHAVRAKQSNLLSSK